MAVPDKIEMTFKMTQKRYKLVWNIEGFNHMPFIREHPLFGPSIRLGDRDDSVWQLLLSKQRGENDRLPSLGFRLVKTEDNTVWDICRYDIAVRSRNGDHKLVVVHNGLAGGEDDIPYNYVKGALEEVFKNEEGEDEPDDDLPLSPLDEKDPKPFPKCDPQTNEVLWALFKEPVLVVECDIRYTMMTNDEEVSSEKSQEGLVAEDLKQLLKSQRFSDVVLRAGEKEFPAHGGILCCRSSELDLLLVEDKAKPADELKVGWSPPIMKMLLLYVYSGDLPEKIDEYDCGYLYAAAQQFGINHLADYCSKIVMEKIRDKPEYRNFSSDEAKFKKFLEYNKKPVEETVSSVKQSPDKVSFPPTPNGKAAAIPCA